MGAKSLSSVSAGAIPPSYKRVIDTAPYLSKSEEYDLSVRWRDHGDKRAADRIVRAHLRLAIRMASKYFGYGLPIEDLVSRSEEHTSELQSLMRISYAVFCLKKKNIPQLNTDSHSIQTDVTKTTKD